jgi:hypothetical protein
MLRDALTPHFVDSWRHWVITSAATLQTEFAGN